MHSHDRWPNDHLPKMPFRPETKTPARCRRGLAAVCVCPLNYLQSRAVARHSCHPETARRTECVLHLETEGVELDHRVASVRPAGCFPAQTPSLLFPVLLSRPNTQPRRTPSRTASCSPSSVDNLYQIFSSRGMASQWSLATLLPPLFGRQPVPPDGQVRTIVGTEFFAPCFPEASGKLKIALSTIPNE